MPLRMIAPIAGRYRPVGEQRLGDLSLGCASAPRVVGAQIEDVPRSRLPRQRAVSRCWTSSLQLAPEVARGIDAEFESIIER